MDDPSRKRPRVPCYTTVRHMLDRFGGGRQNDENKVAIRPCHAMSSAGRHSTVEAEIPASGRLFKAGCPVEWPVNLRCTDVSSFMCAGCFQVRPGEPPVSFSRGRHVAALTTDRETYLSAPLHPGLFLFYIFFVLCCFFFFFFTFRAWLLFFLCMTCKKHNRSGASRRASWVGRRRTPWARPK